MHSLLMNLSIGLPFLAKFPLSFAVFMPVQVNEATGRHRRLAIIFIAFIGVGIASAEDDRRQQPFSAAPAWCPSYVGGWALFIPLLPSSLPHPRCSSRALAVK